MKKVISIMALTAFLLTPATASFALTAMQTATVQAEVEPAFQLTMSISEEVGKLPNGDPDLRPTGGTVMNHGILTNKDVNNNPTNNALRGKAFHVFLGPVANGGSQYTITSTAGALSGLAGTLPHSVGLFAGKVPAIGVLNVTSAGEDAVNASKTLYTSDAVGHSATVELVYGYSGGNANGSDPFTGWQATPPDQAAGTYNGSVVYTLTV